jgi:hypothetical protein
MSNNYIYIIVACGILAIVATIIIIIYKKRTTNPNLIYPPPIPNYNNLMTNPIYTTNQNPKYEFAFNPINSDYEPVYEFETKESKNELYEQQAYEQQVYEQQEYEQQAYEQQAYEQSENIQSFSHQQDIYEPQYDNDNDDSSENYLNFTS